MIKKDYPQPALVPFEEGDFVVDKRPKLLFAAVYAPTFNSDFMVRGFEKAGYSVVVMDWQKIKLLEGVEGLRQRLVMKAQMEEPELIFLHIQNAGVVDVTTADELQRVAPTVSYNFDCRSFEDSKWMYDLAPHLELSIFSNNEDVQRCKHLGINNVAVMQSSADFEHYRPFNLSDDKKKEYPHDIVFIGNKFDTTNMKFDKAAERTQMVEFLQREYGNRFKAWGRGYSRMVHQQEEAMIYNCAKIAITQNNFERSRYCSDRIFRAMGCGVMTIQQYYPEIAKDFNKMVTSTWINFGMLKEEIDMYLDNEDLRAAKSRAGAEFVREKHSWYNRVLEMQSLLKMNNQI